MKIVKPAIIVGLWNKKKNDRKSEDYDVFFSQTKWHGLKVKINWSKQKKKPKKILKNLSSGNLKRVDKLVFLECELMLECQGI